MLTIRNSLILSLFIILSFQSQAQTLNEISTFAASICGKIPFSGSNKASDFKTNLKGQLNPSALKKVFGVELSAEGTYSVKGVEYEGLPFDSLPSQVNNERECKKEMALFMMSGKMNIDDADKGYGSVITSKKSVQINNSQNTATKIGSLPAEYEIQGMTIQSGSLFYSFGVKKPSIVNIYVTNLSNELRVELKKGGALIKKGIFHQRREDRPMIKNVFLMPGNDYYLLIRPRQRDESTAFKLLLKGTASQ
ncbi:hypothetical protein [Alteromonas sp. a30]|uniref:hypothetical protein n=1 Tax=Alteromonas sp. a30 TaxID=2730917 RepID=UPI002280DA34|nr:hypothetical protein [Alteromonas sp. a30]MCY7297417.1 hypothetical protein [Alteromonas sp. a30]